MSDLRRGQGGRAAAARHPTTDNPWGSPSGGRHAFNEDAVLTPIFHALARGGSGGRQTEPAAAPHAAARLRLADPVDEFRRDPLTAPIPAQALVPVPTQGSRRSAAEAHSVVERDTDAGDRGRHHRRRKVVGGR